MNTLERMMAFLFGDGGIENPNANHPEWSGSNCRLRFTHGPKQIDYLQWKIVELQNLGFVLASFDTKDVFYNKPGSIHHGKFYKSCRVKFKSHRLFTEAYRLAYPTGLGGKEYNARWVNGVSVDDYAMAIWWMDDGSLHFRRRPFEKICGYLNICSNQQEALLIKVIFEARLGSEVRIHKKKDKFILWFPHITFRKLLVRIVPWIHRTMLYKCSIVMGEDGNPIIPTSAEHLLQQMKI
jgi:hypothetical protein